jgi:hypothetical protein
MIEFKESNGRGEKIVAMEAVKAAQFAFKALPGKMLRGPVKGTLADVLECQGGIATVD